MSKRRWLPRKLSAYLHDRLRGPRALERQVEKETRAEILAKMVEEAEAGGLYESLDLTSEQLHALEYIGKPTS